VVVIYSDIYIKGTEGPRPKDEIEKETKRKRKKERRVEGILSRLP
jgi:hypothetical protein